MVLFFLRDTIEVHFKALLTFSITKLYYSVHSGVGIMYIQWVTTCFPENSQVPHNGILVYEVIMERKNYYCSEAEEQ